MPTAPSLDTAKCTDIARWHTKNFQAVDTLPLNRPVSLGFTCVTDFCLELFKGSDIYVKPVEGTDYTLDRTAGTITFKSTSIHTWGQTGGGQESWTLIAYFNDLQCTPATPCKAIECCPPDNYAYRSASATDSEAGSNLDCPEVLAEVVPAGGSVLIFPSYVVLKTNVPEAVIRYTLDGTDPDQYSTVYTLPFQVASAGTVVKARGFVGDCSPGPIMTVMFQNPPFAIGLAYACDTPDKGGTWNVWAPNGTVDNHWQLVFTLTALTTITRLELYQLDTHGNWTTGIVWATDSPINPDGGIDFDAFPLLVFVGGVQQWAAYQSSLGAFAAATYTWDLYGEKLFAVGGFFRLDMYLGDGTKISQTISTVCTAVLPPTNCPSPAAPTLTAKCDGKIDVTFTGPVGRDYRLYYSTGSGWTLGLTGNIAASPTTREISGLIEGGFYYVRVDIDYVGCGFMSSIPVTVTTLRDPVVAITTNKTIVDPNESFTISWTSNHIGGAVCGGCLDGEVSLNQSIGCKPANTTGSSAQSKATAGIHTYTITGCNTCSTAVASVQVEVRNVATCTSEPTIINMADYVTQICAMATSCSMLGVITSSTPWNGQMLRDSSCHWKVNGFARMTCSMGNIAVAGECFFSVDRWKIRFSLNGIAYNWEGEKLFGNSPLGVYTRTAGCSTSPSTVTIT